jgi:hypothetical protein
MTLKATCHCGAVRISMPRAPDYINECNCSLCNSHGVWWGYYAPAEVTVEGETRSYARKDKPEQVVAIHFCGECGCTTHFRTMPGFAERTGVEDVMGVNMRLVERTDLAGVELRYPDGANWDGIGQWGFVREAVVLG